MNVEPTLRKLLRRPAPPADLGPIGCALWRSIVADYPPAHFRSVNLALLEALCRARVLVHQADAIVASEGLLVDGKAHPALAIRSAAAAEMRACATKLRLCVSSMQRADSAKVRPSQAHALRKPWV